MSILVMMFIAFIVFVAAMYLLKGNKKESIDKEEEVANEISEPKYDSDSVNVVDKKDLIDNIIKEFVINKPRLINAVERGVEDNSKLQMEMYNFIVSKNYTFEKEELNELFQELKKSIWGYGKLQPLIDDDTVSDIKTIDINTIRIKQDGERKTSNIKFESKEKLKEYIDFIAVKNGITLSEINAIQRVTDTTSSNKAILRIDISSEYVNTVEYPYLHIRKIPKDKLQLDELMTKKNMFDTKIKEYLKIAMKSKLGVLVCGKGGDGKTTLVNALIEEIPYSCSGLVVQEAEELYSNNHPDLMFQKIIEAKGESKIQYTLADLIKNGLVTDIDYMIVGEIKGAEAWDFINAAYTGHVPIGTIHTINSAEAPNKLVHYMKYSPNAKDMSEGNLLETLTGIDVIIFMKDFKINEITEIAGFDSDKGKLILNPIFKYNIEKNKFERLNSSCGKVMTKINYNAFRNKMIAMWGIKLCGD